MVGSGRGEIRLSSAPGRRREVLQDITRRRPVLLVYPPKTGPRRKACQGGSAAFPRVRIVGSIRIFGQALFLHHPIMQRREGGACRAEEESPRRRRA